uniref:Uncharacterized protein n=1 Tax=Rhizophora mucronata TaxID=61149 RepID=A0A2P2Q5Q2_RHIMU
MLFTFPCLYTYVLWLWQVLLISGDYQAS